MKKRAVIMLCLAFLCAGCGNKAGEASEDSSTPVPSIELQTADTGAAVQETDDLNKDTEAADPAGSSETQENIGDSSDSGTDGSAQQLPEADLNGRDLFADYIMGKSSAIVSKDFLSAINMTELTLNPGDEYTVSELESLLQHDSLIGKTLPKVSYAPLSVHGGALYAMQLYYETGVENLTETMIFSDHSGDLEMIFAIDSWSRRSAFVNQEGVVFDDGSNGAGSHAYVTYAPDQSFIYKTVSNLDEEYFGFGFYDEEGDPSATVNAIMNEAGEGNEKAADVIYYREIIDGKRYYYFLKGSEKLTQDTVDYIDKIAQSHNFTFDGKTAADEARTAYEKQLGVEEACQSHTEPQWKSL